MSEASNPDQARTRWMSVYPFELVNSGFGAHCVVTDTSQNVEINDDGNMIVVTNYGDYPAFMALSNNTNTATNECACLLPGTSQVFTRRNREFIALVCNSGQTTGVQISTGYGN